MTLLPLPPRSHLWQRLYMYASDMTPRGVWMCELCQGHEIMWLHEVFHQAVWQKLCILMKTHSSLFLFPNLLIMVQWWLPRRLLVISITFALRCDQSIVWPLTLTLFVNRNIDKPPRNVRQKGFCTVEAALYDLMTLTVLLGGGTWWGRGTQRMSHILQSFDYNHYMMTIIVANVKIDTVPTDRHR